MTKLAYSREAVKTAQCSSGPIYYIENATDKTDWRYLTPEEKEDYEGSLIADDHSGARADDDGMGAAVGAVVASDDQTYSDDNDLGANWGPSDPIPAGSTDPHVEAIAAAKNAGEGGPNFLLPAGQTTSAEGERALADAAIELINSTVGDALNKRYTLVVFHVNNVDEKTTAGDIDHYSIVSTADVYSLARVAENEVIKDFARDNGATSWAKANAANELEI